MLVGGVDVIRGGIDAIGGGTDFFEGLKMSGKRASNVSPIVGGGAGRYPKGLIARRAAAGAAAGGAGGANSGIGPWR